MSALDAPMPSKRAKSTRARDMLYGRQGGRRAPLQTDAEQAAAFAEAVANGSIVRAACFCTYWWLVDKDVGSPCGHCGEAMKEVRR